MQSSRQRRKSGDDVLNVAKEKDKRKDASPGLFEVFRPRSKSDAAQRGKKPTLISNMKNVFQVRGYILFNIFLNPEYVYCKYYLLIKIYISIKILTWYDNQTPKVIIF